MKRIFLAAIFAPALAMGADWKTVASSADMMMQIDPGTIVVLKDGNRKAWKEFLFQKPQKTVDGKEFNRSVVLSAFNCSEKTTAVVQEAEYDRIDGSVISSASTPISRAAYQDVIPGSFDEAALGFVCSSPAKKR